jgi:hypothetical protein
MSISRSGRSSGSTARTSPGGSSIAKGTAGSPGVHHHAGDARAESLGLPRLGAHPLYHVFASLLGIRPAAPGFRSVTITPQLGPLRWLRGELPHPGGTLAVDLAVAGERLTGAIALPRGVTGVVTWRGAHQQLNDGVQTIALDGTSTASPS